MSVLLFLHIALMFAAVAMAAGTLALLALASRTQRLAELGPLVAALPIAKIIPPLFVLGGLAGLATAVAFGYPLLSPWLVIAYVLFAIGVALGAVRTSGLFERLLRGDGQAVGSAIELDFAANVVLFGLIIADMVFKPFS